MSDAATLRHQIANVLVERYGEPELRNLLVAVMERPSGLGALIAVSNRPDMNALTLRQTFGTVAAVRTGQGDLALPFIVRMSPELVGGEMLDRTIAYLGAGEGLALHGMRELVRRDPARAIQALQQGLDTGLRGLTLAAALRLPRPSVAEAVGNVAAARRGSSYLARFFAAVAQRPAGWLAAISISARDRPEVDWTGIIEALEPVSDVAAGKADAQLSTHADLLVGQGDIVAHSPITAAIVRIMAESDVPGGEAVEVMLGQDPVAAVATLALLDAMNIRGPQLAAAWSSCGGSIGSLQHTVRAEPRRFVDAINKQMDAAAFPQRAAVPPREVGLS